MKSTREISTFCRTVWEDEDGAVGILMAVMLPVVAGFTTLAVDMAYVWSMQNQLQITADTAALAGTVWVGNNGAGTTNAPCTGSSASPEIATSGTVSVVCNAAESVAQANAPSGLNTTSAPVLNHADIIIGQWTGSPTCTTAPCGTFTQIASAGLGAVANAVRVTTRLTAANGNAIGLFFTPLLNAIRSGAGFSTFSLTATATAAFTTQGFIPSYTGANPPISDLLVVMDVSSSFSSELASGNPQTAAYDCAKFFHLTANPNAKFGVILFTGNSPQANIGSRKNTSDVTYTVPNTITPAGGYNNNCTGSGSATDCSDNITAGGYAGGWCPGNSTTCPPGTVYNGPYTYNASDTEGGVAQTNSALNSVTASNFLSTMNTDIGTGSGNTGIGDCSGSFGSNNPQYSCSGSNLSAGLQSAINQFCPASGGSTAEGCLGGNLQVVLITDGASNCSTSGLGTSKLAGQGLSDTGGNCSTQNTKNLPSGVPSWAGTGGPTGNPGDGLLLWDDYNNSMIMGNLGITLNTIFYSGEGNSGTQGADSKTYEQELQNMVALNNQAMTTYAQNNSLTTYQLGQYFNEPTGANIPADMLKICASGTMPRLVL